MDDKASLTIRRRSGYRKPPTSQLDEVAYYEGSENPVTYRRDFNKIFSCDFVLLRYPFDLQVLKQENKLLNLIKFIPDMQNYFNSTR